MRYAIAVFLTIMSVVSVTTAQAPGPRQMPAQLKTAAGTLEVPPGERPFPVALIVPGSGAIDRNGNDTGLDLHTDCYKLLAAALAHNGIALLRYDPRQNITKLALPALLVQGKRDLQVDVASARALAKADPAAKLVLIPKMNHVLKDVGQSLDDNMAAYKKPKLPIDPVLVSALDEFIHGLNRDKGANRAH